MYDSFLMGSSLALLIRMGTFRMLRWPHTSGNDCPSKPLSALSPS